MFTNIKERGHQEEGRREEHSGYTYGGGLHAEVNLQIASSLSCSHPGSQDKTSFGVNAKICVLSHGLTIRHLATINPGWYCLRDNPKNLISLLAPSVWAGNLPRFYLNLLSPRCASFMEQLHKEIRWFAACPLHPIVWMNISHYKPGWVRKAFCVSLEQRWKSLHHYKLDKTSSMEKHKLQAYLPCF